MQQPLAHEVELHVDMAHCPPVHAEPPQSRQARPFEPQLLDDGVVMHWFPWQHPDGHDDGVHWQDCDRHSWPASHDGPAPH